MARAAQPRTRASKARPAPKVKSKTRSKAKPKGQSKTAPGRYVFGFGGGTADGRADMKNLLGGKGANLAEMARLGLPVPPGFTISTDVCTYYYAHDRRYPAVLKKQVADALAKVEKTARQALRRSGTTAARLGALRRARVDAGHDGHDPEPRPERRAPSKGSSRETGNERFAYDSYRRFVQMYGDVVLDLKPQSKTEEDPVRDRAAGEEARARRDARHRARRRRPAGAGARVQGAHQDAQGRALPRGPRGAALGRHRRGVRLVEQRARHHLPQAERHPRELGHRGQRPVDGVRQHGRRLRHRRRLHARSRPPARTSSTASS